jgi:hypothetical protein
MTRYLPNHPHVGFIGPVPSRLEDIVAVAFDGDELPLPAVTVAALRRVIDAGLTIRIHARDGAGLARCGLAIGLALGLLRCRGAA